MALEPARKDAVLLDMDGTLVDTEPLWFAAEQAVAARHGVELPAEAYHQLVGLHADALVATLASRYGMDADKDAFLSELAREVEGRLATSQARPGAGELVETVAERWQLRALVSNSPEAVVEATLEPHRWSRLLPLRFPVDLVEHGKPQPDLYLLAAERLKVQPGRCLVVEDSVTGVTAATRAGMTCIAVTFGEIDESSFAGLTGHVVDSLDAARRLLNGA